MKYLLLILSLSLVSNSFLAAQTIDTEASKVIFTIKNMGRTVEGNFMGMQGEISFSKADIAVSQFDVCIDAASVDTGNKKRDKHLKKEDFFEVETYPEICFQSSEVIQKDGAFSCKGNLKMHGITKEVEIPFSYMNNAFKGDLVISRRDFEIGGKSSLMVGKTVNISIICIVR